MSCRRSRSGTVKLKLTASFIRLARPGETVPGPNFVTTLGASGLITPRVAALVTDGSQSRRVQTEPSTALRSRSARGFWGTRDSLILGSRTSAEMMDGRFTLVRRATAKRMGDKLVEINDALNHMRHVPVPEQGRWLGQVMRGYLALLRRADQLAEDHVLPPLYRLARTTRALAAKPEGQRVVDPDGTDRRALAATSQDQPSLAAIPLPRQTPEVGAECVSSARSDLSGVVCPLKSGPP